MTVAAVILLKTEEPGRADFMGKDCDGVEEALGHLREALATLGPDAWEMANIVPGRTVAEIAAWDPGKNPG